MNPVGFSASRASVPELALSACTRLLRPVVRLALSLGLKHADLRQMLGVLLIEEGQRSWRAAGVEPNVSQLSVTTGLNRKAISGRTRNPVLNTPDIEMSAAAKTLTRWEQLLAAAPELVCLPIANDGSAVSFESLAREASRGDLHHRAILDELIRLELVEPSNGFARLKSRSFIPRSDLRAMLAVFSDNAHDHLAAGVQNVLRKGAPMLERSIYATGIQVDACVEIEELVRTRWAALHHELAGTMTRAVDAAGTGAASRIRVGIYAYTAPLFEDGSEQRRQVAETKP